MILSRTPLWAQMLFPRIILIVSLLAVGIFSFTIALGLTIGGFLAAGINYIVLYKKVLRPIRIIRMFNKQQIEECTPEDCSIMTIPEDLIPNGELGEVMRSRNMMLKMLETALRHEQENYKRIMKLEKLKDDLSHMIIHDLKSPLGIMLLTLDILKNNNKPARDKTHLAQQAVKSGKDMQRMIQNLLDISKMEEGKLVLHRSLTHFDQLIRETITEMRDSGLLEQRTLVINNKVSGLHVMIDPDLIHRVLLNLFSNAIKHTRVNGRIEIHVESEPSANELLVEVVDNGGGIPPEYHKKIFEQFEQVNIKDQRTGSGLGLAFCKMAVEAHGGRIWVESEEGKGSAFIFSIPLKKTHESLNGRNETRTNNIVPFSTGT
ncbi:MAG: HAMP domain-containing histidine kinase [Ignavibacteriae bacterium]|nr:HAMP domain-containing histidine kinase [Ignavibacteriota bacterium]